MVSKRDNLRQDIAEFEEEITKLEAKRKQIAEGYEDARIKNDKEYLELRRLIRERSTQRKQLDREQQSSLSASASYAKPPIAREVISSGI